MRMTKLSKQEIDFIDNRLIPIAESRANQAVPAIRTDEDKVEWNQTFHRTMDMLAGSRGLRSIPLRIDL